MEQKPASDNSGGAQQQPEIILTPAPPVGTPPAPDKVCPKCGAVSLAAAEYCFKCGNKLPDPAMLNKKICPGCHAVNAASSQYCFKCGLPLPQQLSNGYENQIRYAGFWVRFVAYIIDAIVLGTVTSIVTVPLFIHYLGQFSDYSWLSSAASGGTLPSGFWIFYGWYFLASFLIETIYFTVAIGKWGRTLGKMALRIKVVKPDGSRVSYWRAFGRGLAYYLNQFTLGFSFLIIAFTSKKRGLHDYIADTVVIKTD
jgi:uncharacterized RDD family membrane protein YckC/ribosomal protein L40E